ncbi:hypothetical protein QJS10_CPA10g01253 [Acorus calamus]|uniref:Uncharacterized protein n=1 Tax=Acorus calamus TaxID=4465 RepID=A0AAV9E258_ACOCL|nr:hypothetical protein QJS10_CPA10g01253 [Acorus calamus]
MFFGARSVTVDALRSQISWRGQRKWEDQKIKVLTFSYYLVDRDSVASSTLDFGSAAALDGTVAEEPKDEDFLLCGYDRDEHRRGGFVDSGIGVRDGRG